jgi:hypothetical protein
MHLPGRAIASASTFLFPGTATVRTALGIVGETFASIELLFVGGKGESAPTVDALQFPISETHWMTSFLNNCELNSGHPIHEKPCLEETFVGKTLRD